VVTDTEFAASLHELRRTMPVCFWDLFHERLVYFGIAPHVKEFVLDRLNIERVKAKNVEEWYTRSNLPTALKFLSYFGAIKMRPNMHSSWLAFTDDSTSQGFFDATNVMYSNVLDYIWPGCFKRSGVSNPGTKGDMLEAFLGLGWLLKKQCRASHAFSCACDDMDKVTSYMFDHLHHAA